MIQLNKILSDYSQVESALAMRTLQPQVKAIQQQYAGDQVFYLAFITVTFSNKISCITIKLLWELPLGKFLDIVWKL